MIDPKTQGHPLDCGCYRCEDWEVYEADQPFPADTIQQLLPLVNDVVVAVEEIYTNVLDFVQQGLCPIYILKQAERLTEEAYWMHRKVETVSIGGT